MGALERARAAYGTGAYDDATIEFLFPEVKESEDERIRSAMIRGFNSMMANQPVNTFAGVSIRDIIAYLEKQKVQKPAEWSEKDNVQLNAAIQIVSNSGHYTTANWLKSLRPHPYWKPSEEQIDAIESAYSVLKSHDTWGEDEHLLVLMSLINDLQKLL